MPRGLCNRLRDIRLDRSYKPVATPRESLYKSGSLGGIGQYLPNLVDRRVQVVIHVHEGVWPKASLNLLAADHLSRPL